jgi:Amidohydrolase family
MPPEMEGELEDLVRILAHNRWPWRLHATYDETIARALDVFERVNKDVPLAGLNWFFDHAETISDRSIDRVAALGGGIAVQHRTAWPIRANILSSAMVPRWPRRPHRLPRCWKGDLRSRRPKSTYRRVRIDSTFGKTLTKAKTAGATVLVDSYTGDRRQAAIVSFPGGYIAEIHSAVSQ